MCRHSYLFFFEGYGDHRDLHVCTHSFPTRRSSDLLVVMGAYGYMRWRERIFGGATEAVLRQSRIPVLFSRSEEHTSELQSLMRISYDVFCLKKKNNQTNTHKDNKTPHNNTHNELKLQTK